MRLSGGSGSVVRMRSVAVERCESESIGEKARALGVPKSRLLLHPRRCSLWRKLRLGRVQRISVRFSRSDSRKLAIERSQLAFYPADRAVTLTVVGGRFAREL